jgi:hypothetical protein
VAENHGLIASTGQATLTNTGTVKKTEGTGTTVVSFAVDNEGMVEAASGTLEFKGAGTSGASSPGSWSAESGAAIVFSCSSSATFALGATVEIQ